MLEFRQTKSWEKMLGPFLWSGMWPIWLSTPISTSWPHYSLRWTHSRYSTSSYVDTTTVVGSAHPCKRKTMSRLSRIGFATFEMCKSYFAESKRPMKDSKVCTFLTLHSNYSCRYRLHRDELDSIKDPEARHRRLVEFNVIEQCINLFKTGVIQRRRVQTFQQSNKEYAIPRIHACVFEPKTGDLKRLKVSVSKGTTMRQDSIYSASI